LMDNLFDLDQTVTRPGRPAFLLHDFLNFEGSQGPPRAIFCAFASSKGNQYKISKIKLSISMITVTPAMESTKASLASW
jgi:hypothetical protein